MQHTLFVVHDDLGSTQVQQTTQTVVAVNHTTVKVVQVGGCEATTVKLNHGAQLGWNHRNNIENHCRWAGSGGQECGDNLKALDGADFLRTLTLNDFLAQACCFTFEVESFQTTLDGFSTHVCFKVETIAVNEFVEVDVFRLEVSDLQVTEVIPYALETSNFVIDGLSDLRHFLLSAVLGTTLLVALSAFSFESSEVCFQTLHALCDACITLIAEGLEFEAKLVLQARHICVTTFFVNVDDHVGSEVNDLFQVLRCHIQQVTQTRGNTLEVPDVSYGGSQFNVTHALTAHG